MEVDNSDQNALADFIEDDDDEKLLISRLPEDTRELQACLSRAQGYLLLLTLRQHLKNIYGLSDRFVTTTVFLFLFKTGFIAKYSCILHQKL